MCGLVGIGTWSRTGIISRHSDAFRNMLIADSARGEDGTGMFSVNAKGKRFALKVVGNPFSLISDSRFDSYISPTTTPYMHVLAGHNRFATAGVPSTENSHPFYHGPITLMHNGTLTNYSRLPKISVDGKEEPFEVDSDALCHSIMKQGLPDTVKNMDGAYAIVYYDQSKKTLNLARNLQRPLWMGFSKKEEEIIWASEKKLIEWVADRHKFPADLQIEELPPNQLYSFNITNGELEITQLPFTGSNITSYVTKYKGKYYGNDWGDGDYHSPAVAQNNSNVVPYTSKKKKKEVVALDCIISKPDKEGMITSYRVGDSIRFTPFELLVIDAPREKFHLIGFQENTDKDIECRANITGKDMSQVYVDELELTGKIQHMVEVTKNGKPPKKIIWITDVKMIDPSVIQLH